MYFYSVEKAKNKSIIIPCTGCMFVNEVFPKSQNEHAIHQRMGLPANAFCGQRPNLITRTRHQHFILSINDATSGESRLQHLILRATTAAPAVNNPIGSVPGEQQTPDTSSNTLIRAAPITASGTRDSLG